MKIVKIEIVFESSVVAVLEDATRTLGRAVGNIIRQKEEYGFKLKGRIFVSKIKEGVEK